MLQFNWHSLRLSVTRRLRASAPLLLLFLGLLPASLWLLTKELPTWAVVPALLAGTIHLGVNYWRVRQSCAPLSIFWHFVASVCALIPYGAQIGFSVAQTLITDAALRRVFTLG